MGEVVLEPSFLLSLALCWEPSPRALPRPRAPSPGGVGAPWERLLPAGRERGHLQGEFPGLPDDIPTETFVPSLGGWLCEVKHHSFLDLSAQGKTPSCTPHLLEGALRLPPPLCGF